MRFVSAFFRGALTVSAAALTLLLAAPQSQAQILPVDAGWQNFTFDGVGPISDPSEGFTLTALTPVRVRITDLFVAGDSFDVFVNSVLTLQTPSVPLSFPGETNPDAAFASAAYSHGEFFLPAGLYDIDINVREAPVGSGGARIRADTNVSVAAPEPAALGLFCIGGVFTLAASRRKR